MFQRKWMSCVETIRQEFFVKENFHAFLRSDNTTFQRHQKNQDEFQYTD